MTEHPDVATMREYVDAGGTRWYRRGGILGGKALERRTRRPEVVVLHHYPGGVREVPVSERGQFWTALWERVAASPYSSFIGAEFKDDARRHMVMIDESC